MRRLLRHQCMLGWNSVGSASAQVTPRYWLRLILHAAQHADFATALYFRPLLHFQGIVLALGAPAMPWALRNYQYFTEQP